MYVLVGSVCVLVDSVCPGTLVVGSGTPFGTHDPSLSGRFCGHHTSWWLVSSFTYDTTQLLASPVLTHGEERWCSLTPGGRVAVAL